MTHPFKTTIDNINFQLEGIFDYNGPLLDEEDSYRVQYFMITDEVIPYLEEIEVNLDKNKTKNKKKLRDISYVLDDLDLYLSLIEDFVFIKTNNTQVNHNVRESKPTKGSLFATLGMVAGLGLIAIVHLITN